MYSSDLEEKNNGGAKVEFWYVLPLAGQSNGMAYGEGLPLPQTLDCPNPRIKQLARRSTITPGGKPCQYNEIIPADHCLHDVQDMSLFHHPKANLTNGEYGCVGQGLHIAKKILPYIPDNAGILLVPCCRGGAAFTIGLNGSFNLATGASPDSLRWGIDTPLYFDLLTRVKFALDYNPLNKLIAVCWMQGEFDLASEHYYEQPKLFNAMVERFRNDLSDYSAQCIDNNIDKVPWLCGDTTWYWKEKYKKAYDFVYGNYRCHEDKEIYFLQFQENNERGLTNEPSEDPDGTYKGYLGSSWRDKSNWTTDLRNSHFNSQARRGIVSTSFSNFIAKRLLLVN
ncbi:sialate O-acetylesterase [Proteus faecis]|uniref:sialate O-acetylesterase n=1 Tax=Proteus faecis TaxID=2050967 RepID=UPI00301D4DB7